MTNKEIVRALRRTASLMELQDENEFKIRGYRNAIYNIERLEGPLEDMDLKTLEKVNGIGKSIAAKINELVTTGQIESTEQLASQTPEGLLEMLSIKGLGIKKIKTMWQILGVTNIDQLEQAIAANKVSGLKGFGTKIQEKFKEIISYYRSNKGKRRYADAEKIANELMDQLKNVTGDIAFTGQLRRRLEVVDRIELIVESQSPQQVIDKLSANPDVVVDHDRTSSFRIVAQVEELPVEVFMSPSATYQRDLFRTTGSLPHLNHVQKDVTLLQKALTTQSQTEKEIYRSAGLPMIAPELRENMLEWGQPAPDLLKYEDLKGILHNHTTYSDGQHSLTEMAEYCKELGYTYLGISDHSKAAAFYANGLDEDRVKAQQEEIDKLNTSASMKGFTIFKGTEADILPDGSIDFDPETLSTFDFVVASIHSVLNMDIAKATDRIIKAVSDPFTTMLGHMTGRQLLIREGYPVDHKAIIDACAEYGVIIEVNSHPNRLDIDWRWIPYALEKGVMISINPDAHEKNGYHDMYYGVCVARKGGLTAKQTFNTKGAGEVADYFRQRREKAIASLK